MQVHRRAFLSSAAAAGALVAGCLGSSERGGGGAGDAGSGGDASSTATDGTGETVASGSAPSDAGTATSGGSGTAVGEATSLNLDHPAAANLTDQPVLGPALGEAPALIIAFEDPSCLNCHRFNLNTFPELESKLIDPGKASFVFRNFPYAFAWGKPAMEALEATFARSESAFWALEHHYYATQEQFDESNVLDLTKQFLASETGLDAAAVVADAKAKRFHGAVQADIDAGEAAGVVSTPTFFLFRDGTFLTEIRGAQSYQVFAQALGGQ